MSILVGTPDGYHVLTSSGDHVVALKGHRVEGFTKSVSGTWAAIVDRQEIWRHGPEGDWERMVGSETPLRCLLGVGDVLFAGGDGARLFELSAGGEPPDDPELSAVGAFGSMAGRGEWHAVGSPLHVRSLASADSGSALLANVHVGGIPRSLDGGSSWEPTIDVAADVHQVVADPSGGKLVGAAAAVGPCVSHDGGATWRVVEADMHARYSRSAAFVGEDLLVCASDGPRAKQSALYRVSASGTVTRVREGLPEWLEGNVDTGCFAATPSRGALADSAGNVWVAAADARGWELVLSGLGEVTAVAIT